MSKEVSPLEALNYIKGFTNELTLAAKYDNGDVDSWHFKTIGEVFPNEFKTIENALKDYEILKKDFENMRDFKYKQIDALNIIKNNLNITEILSAVNLTCSRKEYELVREVLL